MVTARNNISSGIEYLYNTPTLVELNATTKCRGLSFFFHLQWSFPLLSTLVIIFPCLSFCFSLFLFATIFVVFFTRSVRRSKSPRILIKRVTHFELDIHGYMEAIHVHVCTHIRTIALPRNITHAYRIVHNHQFHSFAHSLEKWTMMNVVIQRTWSCGSIRLSPFFVVFIVSSATW